jgi:modulator of FtsH protease HflK
MVNKFKIGKFILPVLFGIWGLTGIYIVDDSENAVVLRFGQHVNTVTDAGINYHLPYPIESVWKENVIEPKRFEFGYRTVKEGDTRTNAQYSSVLDESLMLTGDENLVEVEASMQFVITDIEAFLFNVEDPYATLRMTGETAIRRVVANHPLDDVLTDKKEKVQEEIELLTQEIINEYRLGVTLKAVQLQDVNPPESVNAAFKDVIAAKEDKQAAINQSQTYANDILPKARGEAAKLINEAQAYKQKRISEANGDVAKFVAILKQYEVAKEITRKRMYLETISEIISDLELYFIDEGGNTLPFLPLGKLQ